ncbi:glycoside hydrolase family 3 protein [Streptococcus hyointestinalis]|uniref:glycoside hydrolase family 3 protein n=2 Tax=Streptococcus TaxID=1301 RepID=UPI0013E04238|nr:glycoside hydrolase family 3 N-terminal domain-containing protein [Streptococcus hyointestinalis]
MRRKLKPIVVYLFFLSVMVGLVLADHYNKVASEKQLKEIKTTVTQRSQKEKMIDTLLRKMTLKEKIGQLFWARVPYTNQTEDIKTYHLGGYILFGKDFEGQNLSSVKSLIASYQSAAKIPLLIGSDEEGGTVTRISSILQTPFQSPMSLYQTGGIKAIVSDTKSKSQTLKSVGINAGLFPVADVATDSSAFIYDRTVGQDAKTTANYVKRVVKTLKEEQIGSTLKHFPGYGNNGDSHTSIISDNRSLETLRQNDFLPFKAGIQAGADSVLVAHNILTQIDTVPASISPKVHQILRKELHFKGVIMTDDLDMDGLADFVSQNEAAYQAITAGNDLILGSSYSTQIPYLLAKVSSGELTEKRINASVKRVLSWKYDLGLLSIKN